jgi:hypothetical protein
MRSRAGEYVPFSKVDLPRIPLAYTYGDLSYLATGLYPGVDVYVALRPQPLQPCTSSGTSPSKDPMTFGSPGTAALVGWQRIR